MDRAYFKSRAKQALRGRWFISSLVALVLVILSTNTYLEAIQNIAVDYDSPGEVETMVLRDLPSSKEVITEEVVPIPHWVSRYFPGLNNIARYGLVKALRAMMVPLVLVAILLYLVLMIFLLNPISLGAYDYFRRNDLGEAENFQLNDLLFAFRSPHYRNIVWVLFRKDLSIFLWTLLLFVPGVVRGYQLSQVEYLLAESPHRQVDDLFSESRAITDGRKMDLFILTLSFLGWGLLAVWIPIIGPAVFAAYTNQTAAGIYNEWTHVSKNSAQPSFKSY